jgi:hypothetical protein
MSPHPTLGILPLRVKADCLPGVVTILQDQSSFKILHLYTINGHTANKLSRIFL